MLGTVTKLNKLHTTVLGQDRLIRTYMFVLRCVRMHLLHKLRCGEPLLHLQRKFDSACQQFAMTRKILRWSRTAYFSLVVLSTIVRRKSKNTIEWMKEYNDICFYGFMILSDISDFCQWMCQIGLCSNQALLKATRELGPRLYLVECFWWFLTLTLERECNKLKISRSDAKDTAPIQKRQKHIIQNLIKYALDIPVSYSYINPNTVTPERAVILGTISSFISLHQSYHL